MISWHRFYDPSTGRYISADPIGLQGGINLYAYVGGNPVSFVDPMGLAGNKGIDNWPGRTPGQTPNKPGLKPPSPMPEGYKPNGINNLPGQKMPISPNAGRGARAATGFIRCIGALGKFLEALTGSMLIIYVPTDSECPECPPGYVPYDPNNKT